MVVTYTAARDGWLRSLLRAWGSLIARAPEMRSWRCKAQGARRVGDSEVMELMSARFETELLDNSLAARAAPVLSGYRRAVIGLLRVAGR